MKILLQIVDLNMAYKFIIISENTRNSDFLKNKNIAIFIHISRFSAPLTTPLAYYVFPQPPQPLPRRPSLRPSLPLRVWQPGAPLRGLLQQQSSSLRLIYSTLPPQSRHHPQRIGDGSDCRIVHQRPLTRSDSFGDEDEQAPSQGDLHIPRRP